ncbi:MAG: AI-2E family transporter [Myxococcales bacterium]|nr:AI-2E family transporter [Myxococcales bacterium]
MNQTPPQPPQTEPPPPQDANARIQVMSMVVLATLATGAALYWLRPVMVPFVLALMLTYVLRPPMAWMMTRLRFPHWLAVIAALSVGFLLLTGAGIVVGRSVKTLMGHADAYEQQLQTAVRQAAAWLHGQGITVGSEAFERHLAAAPVGSILMRLANTLVDLLSNTFLVLVFAVYLLQGGAEAEADPDDTGLWDRIDEQIKRYVNLKIALSAGTGATVWLILTVLGIDLAMVFGVMAFALNFVPNVGSVIATLLPLPLVLVSPDISTTAAVLAIALPGAVQMVVGNVLEPKLAGDSLDLHPITVLLALILWGMLWGMTGMLLATPMTAVARLLLEQSELMHPVAELMAGRVSPAKSNH